MAFAGFSAGEAEGLRRAMSRKRSAGGARGAPPALRRGRRGALGRRRRGARRADLHDDRRASPASASRRPTAPRSACWPTSRPGCACTTAPSSSRRCSTSSRWASTRRTRSSTRPSAAASPCCRRTSTPAPPAPSSRAEGAVRLGLGHVLGVKVAEVEALVAERERGGPVPLAGGPGLARRRGAARALASGVVGRRRRTRRSARRSGRALRAARGALAPGRRRAARRRRAATAPSSPSRSTCPRRRRSTRCGDWDAMIADYQTTGLTTAAHPLGLLRPGLAPAGRRRAPISADRPRHAACASAGLVVARQRPGTASGVCFMLLEDEHGTINLVVPPAVYERHRLAVRTEPLVLAEGVLERYAAGGGAVNVLVRRLTALDGGRPARRGGQGLLAARRAGAGAPGAGGRGRRGGRRGRRIPCRGAPRHVLRPGPQALIGRPSAGPSGTPSGVPARVICRADGRLRPARRRLPARGPRGARRRLRRRAVAGPRPARLPRVPAPALHGRGDRRRRHRARAAAAAPDQQRRQRRRQGGRRAWTSPPPRPTAASSSPATARPATPSGLELRRRDRPEPRRPAARRPRSSRTRSSSAARTGEGNMPAGLLTGDDAKDVARYVAAVAGRDDVTAAPPRPPAPPATTPARPRRRGPVRRVGDATLRDVRHR